ncbi:hypothetical protein D9756_010171 [Leucocoprinus leucothites]|uniref:Uncharacterized protein n=1 Tax=Leucocoprinus leucothites TaxID=201217 RepID=A0A8H5FSE7_9AGAR|nr:hypothetical protein D9756_010171 [Leucoagaricus leucothites]
MELRVGVVKRRMVGWLRRMLRYCAYASAIPPAIPGGLPPGPSSPDFPFPPDFPPPILPPPFIPPSTTLPCFPGFSSPSPGPSGNTGITAAST